MGDYILPNIRSMYGNNWYLHQDNDPKHSSHLSRTFLAFNNVVWVSFQKLITLLIISFFFNFLSCQAPSSSPELNPIELVFADLKSFIEERMCSNLNELRKAINMYRSSLTPAKCASFISHLQSVI